VLPDETVHQPLCGGLGDGAPPLLASEVLDLVEHHGLPGSPRSRVERHPARCAGSVLEGEGILNAQISIALVDDSTIRRINKRHLDHDWATDVISFLLSNPEDKELTGELVVSAEMAFETAHELGVDPASELALYVVHGLLHLCGYGDSSESEIRRMRRREDEVLLREGFTNPFSLVERRQAHREGREPSPCSN